MGEEEAVKTVQEEPKVEETKAEEPKPCDLPLVLFVDLHCTGCAKKIERSAMRIRGVEAVSIEMAKNEVTIKGIVDPQAVCDKITKKTNRVAKVLSPSLPLSPPPESEGQLLHSQVSGLTVVELNVNMHCEACAQQLKKKILKMRGVQTASTELSTGKVVVTGTMDGNKLVDYVYRRTKKQARIVPQPEPAPTPAPEPPKPEEEQPPPPPPEAETKTEEAAAEPQPQPQQGTDEALNNNNNNNQEEQPKPKSDVEQPLAEINRSTADVKQPLAEINPSTADVEKPDEIVRRMEDHENMNRMMYQYNYQYHPLYVLQPIPPPQLFSDENPNACRIL